MDEKNNAVIALALVCGLTVSVWAMASCQKETERELTKRQLTAGTNVLLHNNPFVIPDVPAKH